MKDAKKLLGQLQDKYGNDSVMMASQMPRYPAITSGSLALDFAIGIGGLPSDRVIELAGEEGTGKTTLGLLAMQKFLAEQPDRGALLLDLEHKMDPDWLKFLVGEQLLDERVIYVQPEHIEQATNIYKSAVGTGAICFVLIDSIGGAPTARRNDDATVGLYGGNAQGVGEFGRSAAALSAKYRCLTVGINQVREDMGGYNRHMTPGGRAWKHAVALRLLLKRGKGKITEKINNEEYQIGYEIACKVVKSGVAAPGRTASWWFYNVHTDRYGFGIDTMEEIVRLGILTDVIRRRGGWYHHRLFPFHGDEAKVLGKDRLMDVIRANPSVQEELSQEITARLADHGSEVAPMSDPDAPMEESGFPRLSLEEEFDG